MKVLLVVKSKAIETLGVMYLASVVKQAGHECRIMDINEARLTVREYKPDLIGYSIMTGDNKLFAEFDNDTAMMPFKNLNVVGGPDPTFFPEGYDWADYIVKGEGENWMAEYLDSKYSYPTLDSIPWPDRTDFPNMRIRDFIASRGCNWNCSYCFNSTWNKMFPELARVRTRDAKDVVNEIVATDPEFVYFQDSCFAVNIAWMREFSKVYRSRANIPYHCHLRPNMVNEERALLLHDSNCVSVKCALETGSNRLRKLINRGHTNNEDAYVAARWLKKWDIKLILQNILALPTATIKDDLFTLEVNIRCKPAYAWCSIFQPYPATELANLCVKEGYYKGDFSEIGDNFFDKSVLEITEEHKEQVAVLQRIFAFCVEMQVMPKIEDLTWERLPKFVHEVMRKIGDKRMLPGML